MCRAIEEMIKQAAEQAALAESKRMASCLIADGVLTLEKIAKYTDLSLDEVKALQAGPNVQSSISAPETEKVAAISS